MQTEILAVPLQRPSEKTIHAFQTAFIIALISRAYGYAAWGG
ncbi:hypothetical protein [Neisseria sp.]